MRKLSKDAAVNWLIVATCVVLIGFALERRLERAEAASPGIYGVPPTGSAAETYAPVAYGDASTTLVMHLKSTCRFCTASMPFYKSLQGRLQSGRGVRLVVVAHEPIEDTKAYLDRHGLDTKGVAIVQSNKDAPTPLLIAVNNSGMVTKAWIGQQDKTGEDDISSFLLP